MLAPRERVEILLNKEKKYKPFTTKMQSGISPETQNHQK